jgi:hypothetical protein
MATDNAFDYVNAFGVYVFGLVGMSEKARELEEVGEETEATSIHDRDRPDLAEGTRSDAAPNRGRRYSIISYER